MHARTFDTPYGQIPLWGEPSAFEGTKPLVLAIAGAFAIEKGPLFHLAPHLAPDADVVTGHLPGNHTPTLIGASVGVYAAAYSQVIRDAFASRPVVVCGASIGGLVALGLRAPAIKSMVVMEPPLATGKLWALLPTLRTKLRENPADADLRAFIVNVFGATETELQDRRYEVLLNGLAVPTHVIVGDQPLYPERPFEKLPSLVDEPERAWLARQPTVKLTVAPNAGHNIPQQAGGLLIAALREAVKSVSATAA